MTGADIARDDVLDLLGRCTVELWHPDDREGSRGSGFFIAPGIVLTCSHVVAECSERPMVRAGSTVLRATASVASQASRTSSPDARYTGFPDVALVYVPFERHPCAWLDRRIPTRGAEFTAVTRFVPEAADEAADPRPILLRYQQETATSLQSKLWVAGPPRDVFTEHRDLRITKGTSGSPVLDDRTLRVVGMVNASRRDGELVHVVPVVSALAAFAAALHPETPEMLETSEISETSETLAETGDPAAVSVTPITPITQTMPSTPTTAPTPTNNPVIEAWYAHDRHHGDGDGAWPTIVQRHADQQAPDGVPASMQVLPPRFEQRLLSLLARVGDAWIDERPEQLYCRSVGDPGGPVTPGPIHTLRDAVWHITALDASGQALSALARSVAEAYPADRWSADRLRDWAHDYDRLRGRVAGASDAETDTPSTDPTGSTNTTNTTNTTGSTNPPDPTATWPAAVMVRLTRAYRKPDIYRGSVWSRDGRGNWTSAGTVEHRPVRVDAALELVKEDVRSALGKLVHQRPILEFSVPHELFDHPFDTWELFNGRPISELHPVVVRDDEVLDDINVHGYADNAWEPVRQTGGHPPVAVLCRDLPGTDDHADLFRDRFTEPLTGEPDLTGRLVLLPGPAAPPGGASLAMRELRVLWTPMVLWSRDPCPYPHATGDALDQGDPFCGGAHFTATAGARIDGVSPAKIPAEVKVLREAARKVRRLVAAGKADPDRVKQDNPMLASAVLLWDPPNRLPLNFLLAAPSAAV